MTALSRLATRLGALLLFVPIGTGLTCTPDDEVVWVRYNSDDTVQVQVTASEDPGDPVSTDLTSSGGVVVIGEAVVDPGSGPAGTDHEVLVTVFDDYEEAVQRVSVEVDSGERGVAEFDLEQDSADKGFWWLELRSVGGEGETRTDTFTFLLWRPETGVVDPGNDTGDDTGSAR